MSRVADGDFTIPMYGKVSESPPTIPSPFPHRPIQQYGTARSQGLLLDAGLTESLNISVAAAICMHWYAPARPPAAGAQNKTGALTWQGAGVGMRDSKP